MLVVIALSYCILLSSYRSAPTKPLAYQDPGPEDVELEACLTPRVTILNLQGFFCAEFTQSTFSIVRTSTVLLRLTHVSAYSGSVFLGLPTINAP